MTRSVLDIAQAAADIIGMGAPATLIGNSDPDAKALTRLLNRAGQNLTQVRGLWGGGWSVLTREYLFETTPMVAEYALPPDFQELIDGTVWDRSLYREARGALSPQQWQQQRGQLIENFDFAPLYRIRRGVTGGRRFWIDPAPDSRQSLALEYVSFHWLHARDAETDTAESVRADTDVTLLDHQLLEMSLLWRFKQSRGLSFGAELAEYEKEMKERLAKDGGSRKIALGRGSGLQRGGETLGVQISGPSS